MQKTCTEDRYTIIIMFYQNNPSNIYTYFLYDILYDDEPCYNKYRISDFIQTIKGNVLYNLICTLIYICTFKKILNNL